MTIPARMKDPERPRKGIRRLFGKGKRTINRVYWHYTDSHDVPMSTIRIWHIARGFVREGYNGLIHPDGSYEPGRPESMIPAAVMYHNKHSLSYAMTGTDRKKYGQRITPWYPTDAQLATAGRIGAAKMAENGLLLKQASMFHRDSNPTSCPGSLPREGLRLAITGTPPEEEDEMGFAVTIVKMKPGDQCRYSAWLSHSNKQLLWFDVTSNTDEAEFRFQPRRDNGHWIGQAETDSIEGESVTKRYEVGEFFDVREIGGLTLKVECLEGEITVKFAESAR